MPTLPLRRVRLQSLMAAQAAAASGGSSGDAITAVEAWNLRQPSGNRAWCLIRLATKDGREGWGEAKPLTPEAVKSLRAAVTGMSVTAVEPIRQRLRNHPGAGAADIAALDIAAKAAKAPLYQFLGGPTRNKVRSYTSLHGSTEEELAKALERARGAGYKAFSAPVPAPPFRNSGKALVVATEQRMNTLRRAAGEGHDFILSAAGRLTPGDAALLANAFERFHLLFFDEPCSTSSLGALRKIADENVTPLGFGAGVTDSAHFQNLLRDDAVDIVRPDLTTFGITGIRKIAALAEVYYVAVSQRSGEGPVNTAAGKHLAASLPNFFIQHIPYPEAPADREMRAALLAENVEAVENGYSQLSTQPGLGVTIRREALRKYGEGIA